jgi:Tfp pilus assembly protein FimV
MSATQPAADGAAVAADAADPADAAVAAPPAPVSIPALEAEISARRERLAQTIDELTYRVSPKTIINRQTEAAKARFADVATTPEGDLRVERIAAVVAVVAVVGGWLVYRRLRRG